MKPCTPRLVPSAPSIVSCNVDIILSRPVPAFSDSIAPGDVVTIIGRAAWSGTTVQTQGAVDTLTANSFIVRVLPPPAGTNGSPVFNPSGEIVAMQIGRRGAIACIRLRKDIPEVVE